MQSLSAQHNRFGSLAAISELLMQSHQVSAGRVSLPSLDRHPWSVQLSEMASLMPKSSQPTIENVHMQQDPAQTLGITLPSPTQHHYQSQSSAAPFQLPPEASSLPFAEYPIPNLSPAGSHAQAQPASSDYPTFPNNQHPLFIDGNGNGQPEAKRPHLTQSAVSTPTVVTTANTKCPKGLRSLPTGTCKVCCAAAKSGKDYCKSCYGVLYKHIKQIIETIHRDGTKFITGGTKTEMLERLRDAILKTKQRTRRQCEGKCDPVAFRFDTNPRKKCAKCRVLACIRHLPELALQLLRMHLTRAVALAEQTVNIYSELDGEQSNSSHPDGKVEQTSLPPPPPPPPASMSSMTSLPGLNVDVSTTLRQKIEDEMSVAASTASVLNNLPSLTSILDDKQLVPQYVNTGSGPVMVLMPMSAPSIESLVHQQLNHELTLQADDIEDYNNLKAADLEAALPPITLDDDWFMQDPIPLTSEASAPLSSLPDDLSPPVSLGDWQQALMAPSPSQV
eukprot:TRINITY_DN10843_c0_g1_i1.p1 TRINITY_DN10843_c0_g1~~TRINITY_DN10843_c0_g1_i1.p1  ORF type:complete len:505 (+),score=83.35 TRINITY_DN10843_c0_g1_i1:120-1634(+)